MNTRYYPYTTNTISSSNYLYQQQPIYRSNRFSPIIEQKPSYLPTAFQQKLDYLNEKIDRQLKISAEIGAKALSPSPNRINTMYASPQIPSTARYMRNTGGLSYTPDRFVGKNSQSMGNISENHNNYNTYNKYTYVTMPRNISPADKAKILEEEIKKAVLCQNQGNSFPNTQETIKRNFTSPEHYNHTNPSNFNSISHNSGSAQRNSKEKIGLLEKIQVIQENLGIDVEALLDKIFEVSGNSPENPLKKLQDKKKSRSPTPESKENKENEQTNEQREASFDLQEPRKENLKKSEPIIEKKAEKQQENIKRVSFSVEEREKKKINEIRMDVVQGLEMLYSKTVEEFEMNEKKEEEDFEGVAKGELNFLYDLVVKKL